LSSTASGARDDAEKLLNELSDESTADEIMTSLDQAKKLKPTVDGASTDAEALVKSIQAKLEELKELSYESIAKELKTLQDSMEDYSN
jgi:F0F1-type ATP synthase membrane subunit b/b'